jgi:hypothetical protein
VITDFETPIECPNCHKPLTIVQTNVLRVFEWEADEENGENSGRFVDNGQGATEVLCYRCKKQIGYSDANNEWGLFPDSEAIDC